MIHSSIHFNRCMFSACGYVTATYYIASDMLHWILLHIFVYANNNETGMYYAYNFNLFVFRFGVDQLMYSINLSILLLHSCMSLIRVFLFEYYLSYFSMLPVSVPIITCNLVSMISIKFYVYSVDYLFTVLYILTISMFIYIYIYIYSFMPAYSSFLINIFNCFFSASLVGGA